MKPIAQTKFTNLENTVHGNCMAACVASLVECDLSEVPQFEDMDSNKGDDWFLALWNFLQPRGFTVQGCYYVANDEAMPLANTGQGLGVGPGVDGYFIVCGPSPREHVKRGHCVIYKDGVMVHDPHPSGAGLISARDVLMIEKLLT